MLESHRLRAYSASGFSERIQNVRDALTPDWTKLKSLPKRAASSVAAVEWRRILHPRYVFAWADDEGDDKTVRHSTTAWLDGARGVSALQVYIMHFTIMRWVGGQRVYGATEDDYHFYLHPLFRPVWYAGTGAVCNFFLISGFAITTKSFMLMREGRFEEMYAGLGSAVLRRWFRLWLPVIAVGLPMVFAYQYWPYMGLLFQPDRKGSLWEEICRFVHLVDISVRPLPEMGKNGPRFSFLYVGQAWTIPLEFHCSMVSFLAVMLVSRMPSFRVRAAVIAFLALWTLHHGVFWTFLFFMGVLLADLNMEQFYRRKRQSNGLPWQPTEASPRNDSNRRYDDIDIQSEGWKQKWLRQGRVSIFSFFNMCLFALGYYLSGMPMEEPDKVPYIKKPGYEIFYRIKPPHWLFDVDMELRFYHSLSACLLVFSVSQSPALRKVFESRFCQWLGKLSFALYLVHEQVMSLTSGIITVTFIKITNNRGGLQPVLYVVEFILVSLFVFFISALAWRHIDKPTVRFSKWIDDLFTGRLRKHTGVEMEMVAAAAAGAGAVDESLQPLTAAYEDSDTEVGELTPRLSGGFDDGKFSVLTTTEDDAMSEGSGHSRSSSV